MKKNKPLTGFTLIEVILAITIFTLVIGGSFILIEQTINAASLARSKLTAFYLAQEGIEIIRNIRDSNWLKERTSLEVSWNDGLPSGEWEIDCNDPALVQYTSPGRNLCLDKENGFYFYPDSPFSDCTITSFKRKITINQANDDDLYAEVLVQWTEKNRTHSVKVDEHFYNWYGY